MRKVKDTVLDGEPVRLLIVDGAGESAMYLAPEKRNDLVFDYARTIGKFMDALPEPKETLLIGGAGFSIPRWYTAHYPDARIDVVEKDMRMIWIAKRRFYIKESERLSIFHADGLLFLGKNNRSYDRIINDAYTGFSPASSLLTNEAAILIKSRLTSDGVYLLNLITSLEGEGSMLGVMQQAILKNHFAYVSFTRCKPWKPLDVRQNCIIAASDKELPDVRIGTP